MKVKKLIKILKKHNPEKEVFINPLNGGHPFYAISKRNVKKIGQYISLDFKLWDEPDPELPAPGEDDESDFIGFIDMVDKWMKEDNHRKEKEFVDFINDGKEKFPNRPMFNCEVFLHSGCGHLNTSKCNFPKCSILSDYKKK